MKVQSKLEVVGRVVELRPRDIVETAPYYNNYYVVHFAECLPRKQEGSMSTRRCHVIPSAASRPQWEAAYLVQRLASASSLCKPMPNEVYVTHPPPP